MLSRASRPALALSVVLAVLALTASPLFSGHVPDGNGNRPASASHGYADAAVQQAAAAPARIDQRDRTPERAAKHRLVLVAVLTALVAAAVLLRRTRHDIEHRRRTRPAAASPFCGRAPPQLNLLGA